MELTLTPETYAVIHRLMGIGFYQVLDDPKTSPETMAKVVDAVTLFSSWNRVPLEDMEQEVGF